MNIIKYKKLIVMTLIFVLFLALVQLPLPASGDLELSDNGRNSDPLLMMNLSMGYSFYHFRGYRSSTLGTGFGLSYIKNHHLLGVRSVSASFTPHTYGNDLSLLYGRAYVNDNTVFSIASGIGYSSFYKSFGLPIEIRILGLPSRTEGVSFGVHGFAFLTSSNQYFGICLNLGLFTRNLWL